MCGRLKSSNAPKVNDGTRAQRGLVMTRKRRILCISYDESLLITRKLILEQAGFDVTPSIGFADAMEHCEQDPTFDLIVMGHSMPRKDKTALIASLRERC